MATVELYTGRSFDEELDEELDREPARHRVVPGKRTPSARLPPRPIQAKPATSGSAPRRPPATDHAHFQSHWARAFDFSDVQLRADSPDADGDAVRRAARRGVAGNGTTLPYLDRIQQSFGRHDVSGVRAHLGPEATEANAEIGALAYATGDSVAFGGAPDLHTAAHEAAHIVQQRAGIHLAGGVGEAGDAHEQHADAVADRVVAGESAERLLDSYAAGGAPMTGVQMNKRKREAGKKVSAQYSGGTHATHVSLEFDETDIVKAGSPPTADIAGWHNIQTLGLTGGQGQWVRFHVLNEMAGGRGDEAGNLTPSSITANHHPTWNAFEKQVKLHIDPEAHRAGLGSIFNRVEFSADVTYYGDGDNKTWTKNGTDVVVKGSEMAKKVVATLEVDSTKKNKGNGGGANPQPVADATLEGNADGLPSPAEINPAHTDGWTLK